MQSSAQSVKEYIANLPKERQQVITQLRQLILKNLPRGYEEGILYGMISYYIPLNKYPDTYNKQPLTIISLAAQKNYTSLYMMCAYVDSKIEKLLKVGFEAEGKKLNMGKSCIRFRSLDELSLDSIAQATKAITPQEFIKVYEQSRGLK